jgi:hypothetical protein
MEEQLADEQQVYSRLKDDLFAAKKERAERDRKWDEVVTPGEGQDPGD